MNTNKSITYILVLCLASAFATPVSADNGRFVVVDLGSSSSNTGRGHTELDIYRLGLRWDWKRDLWQGEAKRLSGYYEASLNQWDGGSDDITAVAFSPVFQLEFGDGSKKWTPYIEAGIGLSVLSDDAVGGRGLGSSWQFEDRIGFGFSSDRVDIHYRYMHYSNGDIEKPNQGIDAHVIGLSFPF